MFFSAVIMMVSSFKPEGGYKVGDKATDFKLKNVDDKMVSLADYATGKGVIVIFTCNHCPYSVKYEKRIINLNKNYTAKGFPVVAISSNDPAIVPEDSYVAMKKHAKAKKYAFPYLFDETQEVAKTYGALKTPHVFLLSNSGGKFTVEYIGAIDDNADDEKAVTQKFVENAIGEILAGKPVTTREVKAIGCGIKWKKVDG